MGKDSRSADKICFPQDTKKSGRRYARGESKCDVVVDLTLADPAVTFVEIATGLFQEVLSLVGKIFRHTRSREKPVEYEGT